MVDLGMTQFYMGHGEPLHGKVNRCQLLPNQARKIQQHSRTPTAQR
jgi:hypothetical protein